MKQIILLSPILLKWTSLLCLHTLIKEYAMICNKAYTWCLIFKFYQHLFYVMQETEVFRKGLAICHLEKVQQKFTE